MQCFFGRNGHPVLYDCCRVSRVHVSCISLQNLYGSDIRVCVGRVCGVQPKNAPSFYYAHRHFTRFGINVNSRLRKYDVPGLCHTEGLRGLTLIQAPSPRSSLIAQLGRMVVEATAEEQRDGAICLCSWDPGSHNQRYPNPEWRPRSLRGASPSSSVPTGMGHG